MKKYGQPNRRGRQKKGAEILTAGVFPYVMRPRESDPDPDPSCTLKFNIDTIVPIDEAWFCANVSFYLKTCLLTLQGCTRLTRGGRRGWSCHRTRWARQCTIVPVPAVGNILRPEEEIWIVRENAIARLCAKKLYFLVSAKHCRIVYMCIHTWARNGLFLTLMADSKAKNAHVTSCGLIF